MLRGADGRDRGVFSPPGTAGPRRHCCCIRCGVRLFFTYIWRELRRHMRLVTHDSSIARRAQRLGTMKNGKLTVKQAV